VRRKIFKVRRYSSSCAVVVIPEVDLLVGMSERTRMRMRYANINVLRNRLRIVQGAKLMQDGEMEPYARFSVLGYKGARKVAGARFHAITYGGLDLKMGSQGRYAWEETVLNISLWLIC
jgi:hypothetical protein